MFRTTACPPERFLSYCSRRGFADNEGRSLRNAIEASAWLLNGVAWPCVASCVFGDNSRKGCQGKRLE
jgi:hypothetical protein